MNRALISLVGGLAIVIGAAAVSSVALEGQARPALPGADAVKAFVASQTAKDWTPPKTPWGDPDMQGVFTSKDEANTPFARPDKWAGRRIEDITPEELAAAVAKRQERALERAPFAGGGEEEEGVAIAVPIHWFDNLTANNKRPWHVIDPPDGKIPAVTAKGKNLAFSGRTGKRDTYTDRSMGDRCITQTWRGPGLYGNSFQIVQTPDHVVFRREQIHEARMFPIDRTPRPHVSSKIRNYQGDGRGHWEGNTLVVEVRNFNTNQPFRGYNLSDLRLIERFTPIGPNTVEWSVTVDNPTVWSRPWTYSIPLTKDPTQMIHEYACHEGNYGISNILTAGRKIDDAK